MREFYTDSSYNDKLSYIEYKKVRCNYTPWVGKQLGSLLASNSSFNCDISTSLSIYAATRKTDTEAGMKSSGWLYNYEMARMTARVDTTCTKHDKIVFASKISKFTDIDETVLREEEENLGGAFDVDRGAGVEGGDCAGARHKARLC